MNSGRSSTRRNFALLATLAVALIFSAIPVSAATGESTNYLPPIMLRNQLGQQVSLASMRGKPALVSFIHTSCGGVCQMMTAKMKTIAEDFSPQFGTKLNLISITTDPTEDHPAQLKAYAKDRGATGDGWVFLTGKPAAIHSVMKLYDVAQMPGDDSMTHVFDLFLIGPDGRLLHHYHGSDIKPSDVARDIRTAVAAR